MSKKRTRRPVRGELRPDGVTSSQARNIVLPGLVSGQAHEFALQAFGTNNQVSHWSEYVSHMAP